MSELLEIDISKKYDENEEEDLIYIRKVSDTVIKVNFSKLVSHSGYIRSNYKYSEVINNLENELLQLKSKYQLKDSSIKEMLEYVQEGKIQFRIEDYKDIYKLSKYFEIVRLRRELEEIFLNKMYSDLTFSIQTLIDSTTEGDEIDNELIFKIEKFLSERINESICNFKFAKLSVSTIYRILEKSDKEIINNNVLLDLILEKIDDRFILLKFVELDKINNENLDKFIQFFEKEDDAKEENEKYLEYMSFNFSFIKKMKNKYDELVNLFKKTNEELKQTKEKLDQANKELKQTKEEFEEKERKFESSKEEPIGIKSEDKEYAKSIIIVGYDQCNQLGLNPNNKDKYGNNIIIHPPQNFPIEPSSLLSCSVYGGHSVIITKSGSLQGIGDNREGRMSNCLPKTIIKEFSEISMKDRNGQPLVPISAVCYFNGTLFMFSNNSGKGNQLVLCDQDINGGEPVFLDIANKQPLSLFGGFTYSAAISSEGEVIFINRDSVKKSLSSPIATSSLPNFEKATYVALCDYKVIALSSNGGVFSANIERESSVLNFSRVEELSGKEIVCVSGGRDYFLAVSKEGRVFGCGSNHNGELGLGKEIRSISEFTEISSLFNYEIRSAYAGCNHSLFETREGKVLSCGYNYYGQLLQTSGPSDNVYSPSETTITRGATFCIAGSYISSVFIEGSPPPNTPNVRINFK